MDTLKFRIVAVHTFANTPKGSDYDVLTKPKIVP
jgi:hypothetical protein